MLRVEGLKCLRQGQELLKSLNFSLPSGQICGLVGPNGAGKTTLFKCLAGLWPINEGSVFWNEKSLLELDRKHLSREISMMPQSPQIHFDFSVIEVVAMGRYSREGGALDVAAKHPSVEEALRATDMWSLREKAITAISQGERQRTYLARALATESPLLLLDEPTASLDIRHQLQMWDILKQQIHSERLIIISIHDLNQARIYSDQILLLNQGRCEASGLASEVLSTENLAKVFGVKPLRNYAGYQVILN